MDKSNNSLIAEFDFFFKWWEIFKSEAVNSDDYSTYTFFLREAKRVLSKVYVLVEDQDWQGYLKEVMQLIACETKEINIKYKKREIPF